MASQFSIVFTRWLPNEGRREQSAPTFVHRDSFREAVDVAHLMLDGMKCADWSNVYDVASVECVGLGGRQMNGHGGHIWTDVDLAALAG